MNCLQIYLEVLIIESKGFSQTELLKCKYSNYSAKDLTIYSSKPPDLSEGN